jgi:hypothetical protein
MSASVASTRSASAAIGAALSRYGSVRAGAKCVGSGVVSSSAAIRLIPYLGTISLYLRRGTDVSAHIRYPGILRQVSGSAGRQQRSKCRVSRIAVLPSGGEERLPRSYSSYRERPPESLRPGNRSRQRQCYARCRTVQTLCRQDGASQPGAGAGGDHHQGGKVAPLSRAAQSRPGNALPALSADATVAFGFLARGHPRRARPRSGSRSPLFEALETAKPLGMAADAKRRCGCHWTSLMRPSAAIRLLGNASTKPRACGSCAGCV